MVRTAARSFQEVRKVQAEGGADEQQLTALARDFVVWSIVLGCGALTVAAVGIQLFLLP
jgi:hypothetical protein